MVVADVVVVVGVKGFVNIKQEFVVLIRIRLTSHPVPDDDTKDRTLVRRFLGVMVVVMIHGGKRFGFRDREGWGRAESIDLFPVAIGSVVSLFHGWK